MTETTETIDLSVFGDAIAGEDSNETDESLHSDETASTDSADEQIDESTDDESPDTTPVRKFKVKVDGEELEVDESELLNGYSRQADYTRKAQALAEDRKAIEEARIEFEKSRIDIVSHDHDLLIKKADYLRVKNDVEKASLIDWTKWFNQDKDTATQAFAELQTLQAQKTSLEADLIKHEQSVISKREQANKTALAELKTKVVEAIPDWNDVKQDVMKAGLSHGFTAQEMNSITDIRHLKALADAARWNKYQASVKAKQPVKPKVEPVRSNGSVSGNKSLDSYLKAFG